jgi:hypothetical protein
VLSKSRIFKFLKRDCGTIPVAEITSGKIEIFSNIIHMSVLYCVNLEQLYLKDMLAFVVYLK